MNATCNDDEKCHKAYRGRTLMIHGVYDRAHSKPSQLPTEQSVIDDVEQHCRNSTVQDLLQRQVSHLGIRKGQYSKG